MTDRAKPLAIFRSVKSRAEAALIRALDYLVRRDSRLSLPLISLLQRSFEPLRHLRRLPMEWLDTSLAGSATTLEPESPAFSHGPWIDGSQSVEQVLLPALESHVFDGARVSATSSSILLDDRLLVERVKGVDPHRCGFAAGHVVMHGQDSAFIAEWPTEDLDCGIFLGGNGSFNYYHWMIELLPKLQYLPDLGEEYRGFPLLVSDDVNRIPTFREALNLVVDDRGVVALDRSRLYRVETLVYIDAPSTCPFNLRQGHELTVSDFFLRASSIRFLRNRLGAGPERAAGNGRKRIFFARRGGRRNYNQDEVYQVFEEQGFSRVYMEELSLRRQIELVSGCEMIAGPTGAAWTNLIFCRQGTKCLCWMADQSREFAAYSNLAQIAGADLRYVTYRTDAQSTHALYFLDYHVDAHEIRKQLYALLN